MRSSPNDSGASTSLIGRRRAQTRLENGCTGTPAFDSASQIAFIDGGPGIPADIREKIFTPFFTTKTRGSGLGLPTAKRFIEAHNGQIAIDCPAAGGTTVVVRLPMGTA